MDYKNDMFPQKEKDCGCGKDGCLKDCAFYTALSFPLEIEPCVDVKDIDVNCCGDPTIENECNGKCHKIVVTQKFFIKMPVCYTVKTKIGDSKIACD